MLYDYFPFPAQKQTFSNLKLDKVSQERGSIFRVFQTLLKKSILLTKMAIGMVVIFKNCRLNQRTDWFPLVSWYIEQKNALLISFVDSHKI